MLSCQKMSQTWECAFKDIKLIFKYLYKHSFCRVSGEWSETLQELCVSTKFSQPGIR